MLNALKLYFIHLALSEARKLFMRAGDVTINEAIAKIKALRGK